MAVATVADVAVPLMRTLSADEAAYAARLLEWAEALIKARYPDLDALDQDALVMVESQAVARVLRNPDGAYQESLSGEYTHTRDRLGADGVLRIADDEWALLGGAASKGGAFSVDMVGSARVHSAACDLFFGSLTCSCGSNLNRCEGPIFGVVDW